jgi:uncharacterized membrane protein YphA (DoxX/SURF4 family)
VTAVPIVVSTVLAFGFVMIGLAKVQQLPASTAVRDRLGIGSSLWRTLGVVELVAAVALVVGVIALPALAVTALVGLALLTAAAVVAHLRVSDHPGAVPAAVFLVTCLVDLWLVAQFR